MAYSAATAHRRQLFNKEKLYEIHPSSSDFQQTCQTTASRGRLAETRKSKTLNIDAIIDAYLEQSKGRWTLKKSPSRLSGKGQKNTVQHIGRRGIPRFAEQILVAAIVHGLYPLVAQHLADIDEADMRRIVSTERFSEQLETAGIQSAGLRRLDLICALQEVDFEEEAREYAGGDSDEYTRMCEDGRMEWIRLLETAAAMRAAGKWHLVEVELRLEILENALQHYSSSLP
jgi:hypothetical protein